MFGQSKDDHKCQNSLFSRNGYLEPAVNRQPIFPRGGHVELVKVTVRCEESLCGVKQIRSLWKSTICCVKQKHLFHTWALRESLHLELIAPCRKATGSGWIVSMLLKRPRSWNTFRIWTWNKLHSASEKKRVNLSVAPGLTRCCENGNEPSCSNDILY